MRRLTSSAFVLVFVLGMTGCGGSEAEGMMKEGLGLTNDLASAIESNNEAKVKDLAQQLKDIGEKAKKMKLSPDEDKRLQDKYEPELKAAMKRLQEAAMKNPAMMGKMATMPGMKGF